MSSTTRHHSSSTSAASQALSCAGCFRSFSDAAALTPINQLPACSNCLQIVERFGFHFSTVQVASPTVTPRPHVSHLKTKNKKTFALNEFHAQAEAEAVAYRESNIKTASEEAIHQRFKDLSPEAQLIIPQQPEGSSSNPTPNVLKLDLPTNLRTVSKEMETKWNAFAIADLPDPKKTLEELQLFLNTNCCIRIGEASHAQDGPPHTPRFYCTLALHLYSITVLKRATLEFSAQAENKKKAEQKCREALWNTIISEEGHDYLTQLQSCHSDHHKVAFCAARTLPLPPTTPPRVPSRNGSIVPITSESESSSSSLSAPNATVSLLNLPLQVTQLQLWKSGAELNSPFRNQVGSLDPSQISEVFQKWGLWCRDYPLLNTTVSEEESQEGPSHQPIFTSEWIVQLTQLGLTFGGDRLPFTGSASTRKEARARALDTLLRFLPHIEPYLTLINGHVFELKVPTEDESKTAAWHDGDSPMQFLNELVKKLTTTVQWIPGMNKEEIASVTFVDETTKQPTAVVATSSAEVGTQTWRKNKVACSLIYQLAPRSRKAVPFARKLLARKVLIQGMPFFGRDGKNDAAESDTIEFKGGGKPTELYPPKSVSNSKDDWMTYVVGFLNSNGGSLYLGIHEAHPHIVQGIPLREAEKDQLWRSLVSSVFGAKFNPKPYGLVQIILHQLKLDRNQCPNTDRAISAYATANKISAPEDLQLYIVEIAVAHGHPGVVYTYNKKAYKREGSELLPVKPEDLEALAQVRGVFRAQSEISSVSSSTTATPARGTSTRTTRASSINSDN